MFLNAVFDNLATMCAWPLH